MTRAQIRSVTLVLVLFLVVPRAIAHAILMHSTPSNEAVVHARNVDLTLDYNSRIDVARSSITLTGPSGKSLPIKVEPGTKLSQLKAAAANLANGNYHIHWQVLASDGHITRGEIAFTVSFNHP